MYEYSRDVFYYETDTMGVVHHSNFVRWLEEARIGYYASIGVPYADMEAEGVLSPIIGIEVRFKYFARFGDRFTVRLYMATYTGVRYRVEYTVINQRGDVLLEAESTHAFVNRAYRPVSLSKAIPLMHKGIQAAMVQQE